MLAYSMLAEFSHSCSGSKNTMRGVMRHMANFNKLYSFRLRPVDVVFLFGRPSPSSSCFPRNLCFLTKTCSSLVAQLIRHEPNHTPHHQRYP